MALPACEAVMVQFPEAIKEAMLPVTVQTEVVEDVKLTGKPELAVAFSVSGVPAVWVEMGLNVMLCAIGLTANVCATGVAAE